MGGTSPPKIPHGEEKDMMRALACEILLFYNKVARIFRN